MWFLLRPPCGDRRQYRRRDLEAPIKAIRQAGVEASFSHDRELVEQRLVRSIVEQTTKILMVVRRGEVRGSASLDPTGKRETPLRSRFEAGIV